MSLLYWEGQELSSWIFIAQHLKKSSWYVNHGLKIGQNMKSFVSSLYRFLLYKHVNDRHRNDRYCFFLKNFWEKLTIYLMLLVLHAVIGSHPGRSYGVKYLYHVISKLQFCESESVNIISLTFKYFISDVIQKKFLMNCYLVYMNLTLFIFYFGQYLHTFSYAIVH